MWTEAMNAARDGLLSLLFPASCIGCGQEHQDRDPHFCRTCHRTLDRVPGNRCRICAQPTLAQGLFCLDCVRDWPYFERVIALGDYSGPLRNAIRAFKYEGHQRLGVRLAELLSAKVTARVGGIDHVIGVPTTYLRRVRRGFDQTRIIARVIARNLGLGQERVALRRTGDQSPLFGFGRLDRESHIRESYHMVAGANIEGSRVLLVDDVFTTGITLKTTARILKEDGKARSVLVAVLARTVSWQ